MLSLLVFISVAFAAAIPAAPKLVPVCTITLQIIGPIQSLYIDNTTKSESILGVVAKGNVTTIENDLGFAVDLSDVAGYDNLILHVDMDYGTTKVDLHGITPNGTDVRISYSGKLLAPGGVSAVLSGEISSPEDYILSNTPIFAVSGTVPEDLVWLQRESLIGKGRFVTQDGDTYVVYTVFVMGKDSDSD